MNRGVARGAGFLGVGWLMLSTACGPTAFRAPAWSDVPDASPLGPSYVLVPVPTEDPSLLGRVVPVAPEPGQSLEEISRPNPCAEHLSPQSDTPLGNRFEDAQEVAGGAKVQAMLGVFGFEAEASKASHFLYRLETDRRLARSDTPEYVKCCASSDGCGVGYVSALIHGHGEYSTGEEAAGSGSITVPAAGAEGGLRIKVLRRRSVRGYLAALVTITKPGDTSTLGVLGARAFEPTFDERVKEAYEREKVGIAELDGGAWALTTRRGSITENEFARRYGALTHSEELEPVIQRRNTGAVIVAGGLTAGALYLTYWGATNLNVVCTKDDIECHRVVTGRVPDGARCIEHDSDGTCSTYIDPKEERSNVFGILALSSGIPLSIAFGGVFTALLFNGDGLPTSHALAPDDARIYVTRYNRAALREARRKVQREIRIEDSATLRLRPMVGPVSGVFGTF